MKTSEVLNRAADLIEERGWATGTGWSDPGGNTPLCIQGAVAAAMGAKEAVGYRCPAMYAVMAHIGIESGLFNWNDKLYHGRVQAAIARGEVASTEALEAARDEAHEWAKTEVVSVLRAAAVIEAAKESADERVQVAVS